MLHTIIIYIHETYHGIPEKCFVIILFLSRTYVRTLSVQKYAQGVREFKTARISFILVREFKMREFKTARKIDLREFKTT